MKGFRQRVVSIADCIFDSHLLHHVMFRIIVDVVLRIEADGLSMSSSPKLEVTNCPRKRAASLRLAPHLLTLVLPRNRQLPRPPRPHRTSPKLGQKARMVQTATTPSPRKVKMALNNICNKHLMEVKAVPIHEVPADMATIR